MTTTDVRSMEELIEQGRIGEAMVSQLDVARALGVTRQAVQIAERKAMRKLRAGLLECPEVREWLEKEGIEARRHEGTKGRA